VSSFGRPFVKRFAVCPVLFVTLVYCGQTVGWIKMKLGMQVGQVHMLDGDPGPPPPKGHSPLTLIFRPYLLWLNGSMHQGSTWPHPSDIGWGQVWL